jgi:glycosyltransferase involved in cell wall biosynthesis
VRVLHVVPSYLPATRYGGPIYSVHALCAALARRGHDVHVYTTNVDGPGDSPVPLDKIVERDGVKVTYFAAGVPRRLFRAPAMAAALRSNIASFDVLHTHSVFLLPTTVAARAARRAAVPYVIAPRGMLVKDLIRTKSYFLKSAWIALFERANIAGAASMHLTSDVEAQEFHELGFATRRIDVIPNGVDMPSEAPARAEAAVSARPRILSLGRISWKKGLDRLIAAMPHVPEAELVIAGNDDEGYQPQLERLAIELGVADRTRFVGPVFGPGKWDLIRSCDLFAMPSLSENFGIAALEAMASGKAVVVTPEVGLAPTIEAADAGIVAAGSPETLGLAISALLADPVRRAAMGEAGKRLAQEQFSWAGIAERMEAVYRACARRA